MHRDVNQLTAAVLGLVFMLRLQSLSIFPRAFVHFFPYRFFCLLLHHPQLMSVLWPSQHKLCFPEEASWACSSPTLTLSWFTPLPCSSSQLQLHVCMHNAWCLSPLAHCGMTVFASFLSLPVFLSLNTLVHGEHSIFAGTKAGKDLEEFWTARGIQSLPAPFHTFETLSICYVKPVPETLRSDSYRLFCLPG